MTALFTRRQLLATASTLAPVPFIRTADAQTATRTLRFSWWGGSGRHEATLKALRLFEEKNPGIKIKAEYMGFNGYLERLTTQIAGRSEPDVMQINWAWLAMFSKRGNGFQDLNPLIGAQGLSPFEADDLAYGQVGGKLNGLPVSFTARVMLWNEAALQRAGLQMPQTWEELFALGKPFRKANGPQAYALDGELYDMILLSQAWVQQQYGQSYIHPVEQNIQMSKAAAMDWVRTYRRLIQDEVATPLPHRASLGGAEKPTEQQPDWVVGRWAGNYTWDSVINLRKSTLDAQQKLNLGQFPTLPGAKDSGMFGRPTLMYAIGKNSRHAEAAAKLIHFLATDVQAHHVLGRTRGLPLAPAPYNYLKASGKVTPLELAAYQQIAQTRHAGRLSRPAPLFEHARMHKFMREVFERVAYNKITDEVAADHLIQQGQAILQRIR
jgi:oligogalacturonide transport system substrate-binding protein